MSDSELPALSNSWLSQVDIGIRNRVSGLDFCLKKLSDEKLTECTLLVAAKRLKNDSLVAKKQAEAISCWRSDLKTVRCTLTTILDEYREAECKKEDDAGLINELKKLIIDVFRIKRNLDPEISYMKNNCEEWGVAAADGFEDNDNDGMDYYTAADDTDDDDYDEEEEQEEEEESEAERVDELDHINDGEDVKEIVLGDQESDRDEDTGPSN